MGGGWSTPSDNSLIRVVMWESKNTAVSYGSADWPSRSYRLFVFEAE